MLDADKRLDRIVGLDVISIPPSPEERAASWKQEWD